MASHDSRTTWAPEREIVLCRVIAAPRERVFMAWTDPKQIVQWFGPDGFKVENLECDIRPGGCWRFVYTGPDGTMRSAVCGRVKAQTKRPIPRLGRPPMLGGPRFGP